MSAPVATPFSRSLARANPGEAAWLGALRRAAAERFTSAGLPTPRIEAWRTTPLPDFGPEALTVATYAPPDHIEASLAPFRADGSPLLVLVDGGFAASLSTAEAAWPKGITVLPTSRAVALRAADVQAALRSTDIPGNAFTDLNTAAFQDGAWIEVADGAKIAEEIRIVQISTGRATGTARHLRSFVKLGRGARAQVTIIDNGDGGATGFLNTRLSVDLAERSHLTLNRVHQSPAEVSHFDRLDARLGAHSELVDTLLQTGTSWTRSEIEIDLAGERATVDLGGVFIARGRQISDIHTTVSHRAPGVVSRQNYRGLAADEGRGVFHGQIRVDGSARGADATQNNRNMLLSRRAHVHSTPALEILTDDVKCKHGSATGQLDPAQLFYLRSRGIDLPDAVRILTRAFASEILSRIDRASTRDLIETLVPPDVDGLEVAS